MSGKNSVKQSKLANDCILAMKRKQDYLKFKNISPIPTINGRTLNASESGIRLYNFERFVKIYMNQKTPVMEGGMIKRGGKIFKIDSRAYEAFKRYSDTVYGSAVINELLNNHSRYLKFTIYESSGNPGKLLSAYSQDSDKSAMYIPNKFPIKLIFPTNNQRIDPLAIIHHEFYHTGLWQKQKIGKRDSDQYPLVEEKNAVIYAENPVRILNGFEPRFTYHKNKPDETINIVNGDVEKGEWTVNKYDITKLVKLTDKDAL